MGQLAELIDHDGTRRRSSASRTAPGRGQNDPLGRVADRAGSPLYSLVDFPGRNPAGQEVPRLRQGVDDRQVQVIRADTLRPLTKNVGVPPGPSRSSVWTSASTAARWRSVRRASRTSARSRPRSRDSRSNPVASARGPAPEAGRAPARTPGHPAAASPPAQAGLRRPLGDGPHREVPPGETYLARELLREPLDDRFRLPRVGALKVPVLDHCDERVRRTPEPGTLQRYQPAAPGLRSNGRGGSVAGGLGSHRALPSPGPARLAEESTVRPVRAGRHFPPRRQAGASSSSDRSR